MAELLMSYDAPVIHKTGRYHARAVGRQAGDGMWEGWFEFEPLDSDEPVTVGPAETRQPEFHDLTYWATGITPVYLEGALARALHPLNVSVRIDSPPVSEAPAPRMHTTPVGPPKPDAILNPFEIGERNLDILRQELGALNRPRLLNIIDAFDLNPGGEDVDWMSDAQLATFIVTATEVQLTQAGR
jgi:hypothetical protein